ncbi:MAG TPA: hypothetical protein VEP90_27065 [Methylomirabilota bacterium]|nr:hypothetical protein [Methylomirabilota bacterium]
MDGSARSIYMKEWRLRPGNKEKEKIRYQCWQKKNKVLLNKKTRKWKKDNPKRWLLNKARQRAKEKNLEFSITINDFDIPDVCPVLGITLIIGNEKQSNNSPTLDRFDNSKGYIPGNIKVISWRANDIKRNSTIEELEAIIKYIKENCIK